VDLWPAPQQPMPIDRLRSRSAAAGDPL